MEGAGPVMRLSGLDKSSMGHGGSAPASGRETRVRIFMVNSSQTVVATVQTPGGSPRYDGDARLDGVPGTAAGRLRARR